MADDAGPDFIALVTAEVPAAGFFCGIEARAELLSVRERAPTMSGAALGALLPLPTDEGAMLGAPLLLPTELAARCPD